MPSRKDPEKKETKLPHVAGSATEQKRPTGAASHDPGVGIVVVGASAGGLQALQELVGGFPASFPWPVVVILHMDPRQGSHLAEILNRDSKLPVKEATRGTELKPGVIYTAPPGADVAVSEDRILTVEPAGELRVRAIDHLFTSVARSVGENVVAVVLSGTGSDGAAGAITVKTHGGAVIAQSEASAQHFGMPGAAIRLGAVDFVRRSDEIAPLLMRIVEGDAVEATGEERDEISAILKLLHARRGTTFELYREGTLRRRNRKRMVARGVGTMAEYHALIEADREELDQLFDALLINVTEFFRDADAWAALTEHVIPDLAARRSEGHEVRVWCAGCATGEEAYSIAMLLAEALPDAQDWNAVKIFATDVDDKALIEARAGRYDPARLGSVSAERLARFFEPAGPNFEVSKALRRMVVFGVHDLTKDPPIGRTDLIICRNVLIYFDIALQRRVLSAFHYSLAEDGRLFLGKSEGLPRETIGFVLSDRRHHIYRRTGQPGGPFQPVWETLTQTRTPARRATAGAPVAAETPAPAPLAADTAIGAIDALNVAVLLLDRAGGLRYANRFARTMFDAPQAPGGRSIFDVIPALREPPLRASIENALTSTNRVRLETVHLTHQARQVHFDFVIEPLGTPDSPGLLLIGQDVTSREETRETLRDRNALLQETVDELQTTNEELQSTNEELVTANEELQSSNEELATVNEELQSTNEELATTNEELSSTNEELTTLGNEVGERSEEVERMKRKLRATVDVTSDALILCDEDENIALWSVRAREFFGHHEDEVRGRNLFSIDLQIPAETLRTLLAEAKTSGAPVRSESVHVRGTGNSDRWVTITVHDLRDPETKNGGGWALAVSDRTREASAAAAGGAATALYRAILDHSREGILVLDGLGAVKEATVRAHEVLGVEKGGVVAGPIWELTADRGAGLQLKGAFADLSHAIANSPESSHEVRVPLRSGKTVKFTFVRVSATGLPPIVVLDLA